jgi:hypothetical protein
VFAGFTSFQPYSWECQCRCLLSVVDVIDPGTNSTVFLAMQCRKLDTKVVRNIGLFSWISLIMLSKFFDTSEYLTN